jgi:hypothetical protein
MTLDNHPWLAPCPASASERITVVLSPNPSNPRPDNCSTNQVLEMMTIQLPPASRTSRLSHNFDILTLTRFPLVSPVFLHNHIALPNLATFVYRLNPVLKHRCNSRHSQCHLPPT